MHPDIRIIALYSIIELYCQPVLSVQIKIAYRKASVGYFIQISEKLLDYFLSAGAAGAAGAEASAGAAGALAEDIGFCSGAGAAAGAGAGASSFFLQPAVKARARVRHKAKEISFFIDFSLLF